MKPIEPLLKEAINKELAIPIYINHVKVSLFWSGLDAGQQKSIKNTLAVIKKESLANVKKLRQIKKYV